MKMKKKKGKPCFIWYVVMMYDVFFLFIKQIPLRNKRAKKIK